MPTLTVEYQTGAGRRVLEQAPAFPARMRHVGAAAPAGTVLAACERVALDPGRRLVRDALGQVVRSRAGATDAPKKRRAPGPRAWATRAGWRAAGAPAAGRSKARWSNW